MNNVIVFVILAFALVIGPGVTIYNLFRLRRIERDFWEALETKAPKRRSGPKPRGKRVPVEPIMARSPDGAELIVGGKCTGCGQTINRKGGHTIAQCERFQEENRPRGNELSLPSQPPEEAHDPPADKAPGAEELSHDD